MRFSFSRFRDQRSSRILAGTRRDQRGGEAARDGGNKSARAARRRGGSGPLVEIVPGDIVLLSAGAIIPGDADCSKRANCSSTRRL